MVEVSTSLLNVEKENILGCIYNLEVCRERYNRNYARIL